MSEFVRSVAPFLAAAYLVFVDLTGDRGKQWFCQNTVESLQAFGYDISPHIEDVWADAKLAHQPGGLASRLIVVLLGFYLLLPEDGSRTWLGGLALFAIALAVPPIFRKFPLRGEFVFGAEPPDNQPDIRRRLSYAQATTLGLVLAGLVASLLKSVL